MKTILASLLFLAFVSMTNASPITINFSAQPGGYTFQDGTPCAASLFCQNATPRGSDFLIRDASGQLLSTIRFTPAQTQSVSLNDGQLTTVSLGSFSFTGQVPPPVLYTLTFASLGASNSVIVTFSLSFAANEIRAVSSGGLFSVNGAPLQIIGTTSGSGQASVLISNLTPSEVPEPMTLVLVGSGLAALLTKTRRRRRRV